MWTTSLQAWRLAFAFGLCEIIGMLLSNGSARSWGADADAGQRFSVSERADRLVITRAGQPVAEYVFADDAILRPYFANLHAPGGTRVTRNHPPRPGVDELDHDQMHPGVWLAFGDVSGIDFWRNRGRIRHLRFSEPPTMTETELRFATLSQLETPDGQVLGTLSSRFLLAARPAGRFLIWDATLSAQQGEIAFGDQEEMGFGARVATPLTEKNGGRLTSSTNLTTAAATWGQPAAWCDYSGQIDERPAGITLMAAPENFRASWWHNRDYGPFVANPFGRSAMKQGQPSVVRVPAGEELRLRFAAVLHDGQDYEPAKAYQDFLGLIQP